MWYIYVCGLVHYIRSSAVFCHESTRDTKASEAESKPRISRRGKRGVSRSASSSLCRGSREIGSLCIY